MIAGLAAAVASNDILVDTDDSGLGLDAGRHGGHGACGIGDLLIGVVGFGEGKIGKILKTQGIFFASLAP